MAGSHFSYIAEESLAKKTAIDMLNRNMNQWREQQPISNFVPRFNNLDPIMFGNMEYAKANTSSFLPLGPSGLRTISAAVPAKTVAAFPNPSSERINIELERSELWNEFHQHVTEMVVTKPGRRMFPTLRFRVTGLDPATTYGFYMVFFPVDKYRYKFQCGQWSICGQGDTTAIAALTASDSTYQHPDSPAPGRMWMNQPISFHRIKLTNCAKMEDMIVLNSMHKYQPRLIVVKLHEAYDGHPLQIVAESSPLETQFIAVTAYQNTLITQLKVKHNPFAKGVRQNASTGPDAKEGTEELQPPEKKRSLEAPELEQSNTKSHRSDESITPNHQQSIYPNIPPVFPPNGYCFGQTWPLLPPPAFYMAAEMARAAAVSRPFYQRPLAPVLARPVGTRRIVEASSPVVQVPAYASPPSLNLPIEASWPHFAAGSNAVYGANGGMRFTMY